MLRTGGAGLIAAYADVCVSRYRLSERWLDENSRKDQAMIMSMIMKRTCVVQILGEESARRTDLHVENVAKRDLTLVEISSVHGYREIPTEPSRAACKA